MKDFRFYSFFIILIVFSIATPIVASFNLLFGVIFIICFMLTAFITVQLYVYFLFWPFPSWIDKSQVSISEVEVPSKLEGKHLKAVVLRNKLSDPNEKQVGILFHHGYTGNIERVYKYALPLAVYGCTVLCIDARGHGKSKSKDLSMNDFVGILSDVENEITFLENLDGVDKNRLCMMGTSMGAQMSLTGGYQDQRIKKIVGISGTYDILEMFRRHKTVVTKYIYKNITQNDKDDLEAWNKKVSAKYFLEKKGPIPDKDRVYLVHGKDDNLVIFEEALLTKKALNLPDENVLFLEKPEKKYTLSAHGLTGQETIVTAFLINIVNSLEN